jgi:serine/threonine-protein kinase
VSTSQHVDPLIGRLVDGRYRVRARIARGGMATVYVATDLRLERRVALKVMHGHLSDDAVFQSRFIQEARSAARLADPHVVNVFDQGQDDDMAYLVMEYLPGITLRELLREQRRLTVPQAMTIMDAIVSGLAAAHRAGIVHRDVKPENVLLAEDGRIKIGDFGLARATTANTATGQMLLGTIAYLAPELVTRGTADARSDIYSLGIMLYEMLTGEQPYKGEQPMQIAFQHATDSVPRPSVKNPAVPEQVDELVLWATERSPDERPLDAGALLDRLREVERELGIAPQVARTLAVGTGIIDHAESGELTAVLPATLTGPTATVGDVDNATRLRRRTQRRATRGGWLFALVLVLTALAAGAGWWFGSGPGSLVAVPDVATLDFTQAQERLAQDSLVAVEQSQNSLEVPPGIVIGTDPPAGSRVDREAQITVFISAGPAEVQVEALAGRSEGDARGILEAQVITLGDNAEFFADAEAGVVVGVTVTPADGSAAIDCTGGCVARQGDTAVLSVSVGQVPDIAGDSEGSARSELEAARLVVAEDVERQPSDSVDADRVIGLVPLPEGTSLRPGDTVTLIVSSGPPLFAVPNVVGMTRDEAKRTLTDAGFTFEYLPTWDIFPDVATEVEAQEPKADSMVVKGSRVSMRLNVSG